MLVTGANGFVGRAVCAEILRQGMKVRAITRLPCNFGTKVENIALGNIDHNTNWRSVLVDCDAIIHLAARVHMIKDPAINPLNEFRQVNVLSSWNLARQAAEIGVKRFVFISSIGVNGAETFQQPFTAKDVVAPHSPYAISKYEAELELQALSAKTNLEVVIIRPPLVYGFGAPGNFGSLLRWIRRNIPLPLGSIHNQRSLVALDNLADLIVHCVKHPAASAQIFLASDNEDVSTTELLLRLSQIMGRSINLIPVPVSCLRLAATVFGKQHMFQSLCGSLQVDIDKTCNLLGWRPPITLDQGLKRAVEGCLREEAI